MELLQKLKNIDASQILTDPDSLENYGRDWTKNYTPKASAVLLPKTTEEVQNIVLWANENKIALVPSGGRTGLSAAAFALNGEVILSLEKMNKIKSYSPTDEVVHCEAGVITEQLQTYAKEQGAYYPVDFAARGSSQIGGNIATNAGGIKVIRYGLTRNWVTGLTVVTGAGEILKLNNSLVKNASGYDLRHLFIGSEGTLGVITEAEIKLTQAPKDLHVFVFGVNDLSSVMNIYNEYKTKCSLSAYEMYTDLALKYVLDQGHLKAPLETDCPFYILMEIEEENESSLETAMGIFESCMEKGWIIDGTLSQSESQAADLWRIREDITEATSVKSPYKNDVSVKISKIPDLLENLNTLLKKNYPDFEVVYFGHIGDGNLHINILKPDSYASEDFLLKCKEFDKLMFSMIEKLEGSISAEHGVGLTKKDFLHHTRSPHEIALMKQIKKAFDPNSILNPGKVFD